jgi:SH3-like domain-containing protein
MMVLVQASNDSSSSEVAPPARSTAAADPVSSLTNCQITTWYRLNLRNAPNGAEILLIVPHQVQLASTARTPDWFKVTYKGIEGWLAARYLGAYENCRAENIT